MSSDSERNKYFESDIAQALALVAMVQAAQEMMVGKGVAFVLVKKKKGNSGEVLFKIVNNILVREPIGREVEAIEAGTNYFGVAMGKLAVMMSADTDSGTVKTHIKKGESPYRGGLVRLVDDFAVST